MDISTCQKVTIERGKEVAILRLDVAAGFLRINFSLAPAGYIENR